MKNNKVRQKVSVALGVLLTLLLFATPYCYADDPAIRQVDKSYAWDPIAGWIPSIIGTWVTSATLIVAPPGFPSDRKFLAVETFNSDGTMFVVSQLPGVTIGNGVWKSTGPFRYTFTFTFYRPDPSSPEKMLPVLVNENVKMIDNNSYVTTDVILPLDANGQPLTDPHCGGPGNPPVCAFPGTVQATRYPFANINTVLP